MIQNLLKSWKTTSAGITSIIGLVVHLVFAVRSHTADENTWTVSLVGIMLAIGLIFAGDASQSQPVTPPSTTTPPTP